ncbi:unnamed protein product [Arabidopsis thaliana]|uniref:DUF4283 domain-containing protein n=1 Tax=Arabidopsis thaliana TaxID=3702 RepID=A0A654ERI1_ARATH|nr:unnamed protein product [Arabidopsis thaliana]
MEKDLWEALQNLNLGSERTPLRMSMEARRSRDMDNRLSLVVKGLNPHHQKPAGIKATMPKAWRMDGRVTSRINDDGTVQFFFKAEHHLMTVLENGPWHHNYWMVAVDRWTRQILPTYLTEIAFWVRIVEATSESEGEVWAHVTMRVTDRYIDFEHGKEPVMIRFIFSKLKKFCFKCGSLLHDETHCDIVSPSHQLDAPNHGQLPHEDEVMGEQSESSIPVIGHIQQVATSDRQPNHHSLTSRSKPLVIKETSGPSKVVKEEK